ncbi:MAG TPA: hypothetical protein VEY51_15065 [Chondromyces sp.]|nr:hypothetical protein [Chondromyces sp.]
MLTFFIYLFIAYLAAQFLFSVGYAVLIMSQDTDINERIDKVLKHISIAAVSGAVALYLLFNLLEDLLEALAVL